MYFDVHGNFLQIAFMEQGGGYGLEGSGNNIQQGQALLYIPFPFPTHILLLATVYIRDTYIIQHYIYM